ncbi:MAG: FG-GAP-like repeat-containing protein, partial [Bacteroidota bacterium]
MRWHLTRSRSLQTVCRAMQAGVLLLCLWVSPSLAQIVQPLGRIGNADLGARRAIGLTDFGISMANVGDLNGDGTPDVAVLSHRGDSQQGALWLLFLNPDGTVNDRSRLSAATDERLPRVFGWGLASLGDVDGNGSVELAVTGVTTGQSLDRARLDQLWLLSLSPGGQLTDVVPVLLPQPLSTAPHRVHSLAAAGDIDGDGRSELALGVTNETSGERFGLLFFLKEGAVRTYQAYRPGQGALRGLGDRSGLIDFRGFGESVASVGDLDGNGVSDLAIGAVSASGTYPRQGGVVILFLQRDGTMLIARAITEGQGGFTDALQASAGFGGALANVGDLDGDGRAELAVAATRYDGLLEDQGAVWILSLGPEGRVIRQQRIGPGTGGFAGYLPPLARFGFSLAGLGDLDGDGTPDLMVRVKRPREDLGERGGLWTLFLEPDGSTRHQQAIHAEAGGLANALSNQDYFGAHAIRVGDVDGNGVVDLAVGAPGDDVDGKDQGALWILLMDNNGRVMQHQKVSGRDDRFPTAPVSKSSLGMHMVPVGDVDGDGVPDVVVSRAYMLRLDSNRGLAWLLLLERTGRLKQAFTLASIDDQFGGGDSSAAPIAYRQYRQNGKNLARLGDLDGNGVTDLLLRTGPLSTTVLFLGADGQSLREQPLSIEELGIPAGEAMPDDYHYQLYSAGDFDGDGRETVALVSTPHNDQPKPLTVRLIDFDASGTVERSTQLPLEGLNLRPATLQQFQQWYEQQIIEGYPWKERFEWQEGLRVYPAGDLDGDAVPDLALVVYPALLNTPEQGNIWQVYMTRAGTVKRLRRLPLQTARPPGQPASATGNAVTSVVRLDAAAMGTQPVLGLGRPFDNRDGRGRGTIDIVQLAPAYTAWLPRLGYGVLALGGLVVLVALAGRVQTRRLRRQNEALEQVVQERTAEVAAQADALQRANDLKAHFLANISHEFRTPLTLTFGPIRDLLQGHYESFE